MAYGPGPTAEATFADNERIRPVLSPAEGGRIHQKNLAFTGLESQSMNGIVGRCGHAVVTTAALAIIVAALLAVAPRGVDAISIVASNAGSPTFDDGSSTTRTVPEDTQSGVDIGQPVSATDPDNDTLNYSLSGQDANLFDIDATTGQLSTSTNLAGELRTSFRVEVMVHDFNDGNGNFDTTIDDTIDVTITVTSDSSNGGGGGIFGPAPVAPKFADGFRTDREVFNNAEGGDPVGEPVVAAHQDNLAITYSLSGTDAASFTVDEHTGQIRVRDGVSLVIDRTFTVNLTATDSAKVGAIIIVDIVVVETPYHDYDANQNRTIERDEVFAAISDYFDGEIEKEEVIELISLYFAQA